MKSILIFLTLLLLPISVTFGQAPPSDISAGIISRNGGNTNWGTQACANINVIQQKDASGKVTSQAYLQLGGVYADDIYLTDGQVQELEALTGYAVVERFYKSFNFGTGVGVMNVEKSGDNDYKVPFLFKAGYNLFNFLEVGIRAQYIPIKNEGDIVIAGPYFSIIK